MKDNFKYKKDSEVLFSQLMLPSNSNFSGKIHGGYILSLMDQIAFACASKHSGNYSVTASVNTVDFLNPIEVGELVTLRASINYTGKSSMVVGIRVDSENIRTGEKKHCNSSYFTMVAKNEKGESVPVPGIILENDEDIRRFLTSIKRQELKSAKTSELKEIDFHSKEYLEQLKEYNVKII
jgi:acyl-CoA hydrolase